MRLSPLVALWLAWAVFVGVLFGAAVLATPIFLDRVPELSLGLGVVAALAAVGAYRALRRGHVPVVDRAPGALGWFGPVVALVVGLWPAVYFDAALPESSAYSPGFALLYGNALGIVPMGAGMLLVAAARRAVGHGGAGATERVRWWWASSVVFGVHAAWASTLTVVLGFLLSLPAFEGIRRSMTPTDAPRTPGHVGFYPVDHAGYAYDICGHGPYLVVEKCDSPRGSTGFCFTGSGGQGFYYSPPGSAESCFNIAGDGALPGGWRWYVAD